MLFGSDRSALRRVFMQAWQCHRQGLPLEPLQARIVDVITAHPQYQRTVEDADALERDYDVDPAPDALADAASDSVSGSGTEPASGHGLAGNPFLHMAMHLALAEQCATDRPPGIGRALARMQRRGASAHEAQHQAMHCLRRALWVAQREGRAPDEAAYLKCVQAVKTRRR